MKQNGRWGRAAKQLPHQPDGDRAPGLRARLAIPPLYRRSTSSARRLPMSVLINARRRKPECNMAFHVERRPQFLIVAIKGDASFEQAELISAELLRIPLDGYSVVV